MSKDIIKKISRSLPAEGAIIGPGNGRRGHNIQTENELKSKMEALDTSYKISSRKISAETRELKRILYDLQRELRVSQTREHYIPSPIEGSQPGIRSRKNSRVKKEPSTQKHSHVNTDFRLESQQDVSGRPDTFTTEGNISPRRLSVAKRRKSSNSSQVDAKKIKELTTLVEKQPTFDVTTTNAERSAAEEEQNNILRNKTESVSNDKDKSPAENLKKVTFADDLENSNSSTNPVFKILTAQEPELKFEIQDISLLGESTENPQAYNKVKDSEADSSTRHSRKKRSSVTGTLDATNLRILSDRTPPRIQHLRKLNDYEPSLLQEGGPRQRRMTVASHSVPTANLANIREELPRTPFYHQSRKYSMPPVRQGRKPSLAQQHLMRFFPQSGAGTEQQQSVDVSASSSRGSKRIGVAARDYSRGRKRLSSLLPPLKEEVKVHSTPGVWTGLQDCRYLRTEDNEISIEDIFRKD